MRNVCGQEELLQIFGTELVAPTKNKMKIESFQRNLSLFLADFSLFFIQKLRNFQISAFAEFFCHETSNVKSRISENLFISASNFDVKSPL